MGHIGICHAHRFRVFETAAAPNGPTLAFAIVAGLAVRRDNLNRAVIAVAIGIMIFFQAARLALVPL